MSCSKLPLKQLPKLASGRGIQSCGLPAANSRSFINTYEEFITIYYCYISNMHNVQEETQ